MVAALLRASRPPVRRPCEYIPENAALPADDWSGRDQSGRGPFHDQRLPELRTPAPGRSQRVREPSVPGVHPCRCHRGASSRRAGPPDHICCRGCLGRVLPPGIPFRSNRDRGLPEGRIRLLSRRPSPGVPNRYGGRRGLPDPVRTVRGLRFDECHCPHPRDGRRTRRPFSTRAPPTAARLVGGPARGVDRDRAPSPPLLETGV